MTVSLNELQEFLETEEQVICVELARVRGSSPREKGARMFVSSNNLLGTIGGGQLEYMAIDEARVMLRTGASDKWMDVPLGPEIGQCCGGRVEVLLSLMDADQKIAALELAQREIAANPMVLIIGAGHVGRALASIMALMPVQPVLIDSRRSELELSQVDVDMRLTPLPEAEVRNAPAGSAVVILTHEHSLDFLVAAEALARSDLAYVGMIGSKTKRASFEKWLAKNGERAGSASNLICPMGVTQSADKRPEVIASFVAAEVMEALTRNDQGINTASTVVGEKKRRCRTKHTA